MSTSLQLLVGLGNPDPRYLLTRHNAGFWLVDSLAMRLGASFRPAARFFGETCEVSIGGARLRLLKPMTYMNESGRSVAAIAGFYRIDVDAIAIAHDDIDLAPGTVRIKVGGGHGGHNGLRDVVPALGDPGFARIRIGVGHPGQRDDVVDYVLARAPAAEEELIHDAIGRALDRIDDIAGGHLTRVMNELNRKPKPPVEPGDEAGDA